MGGLCKEGHEFLHLCKKRNKAATLHLLDVLVTQHAKWTAKRVRRGLFGQSIVDFSTASWTSIQLSESAKTSKQAERPKKTSRLLRTFADERRVGAEKQSKHPLVPGTSQYSDDEEMDAGTADHPDKAADCEEYTLFSQTSDVESDACSFSG